MHRDIAERLVRELLSCSGKLDQSVSLIHGVVEDEVFCRYRRQVGEVMGLLYIELLREIYAYYPDLEPESMR